MLLRDVSYLHLRNFQDNVQTKKNGVWMCGCAMCVGVWVCYVCGCGTGMVWCGIGMILELILYV